MSKQCKIMASWSAATSEKLIIAPQVISKLAAHDADTIELCHRRAAEARVGRDER